MIYAVTPTLAYGDPEGEWDVLVDTVEEAVLRITSLLRTVVPTKDLAIAVLEELGVEHDRATWLATPQKLTEVVLDGWDLSTWTVGTCPQ